MGDARYCNFYICVETYQTYQNINLFVWGNNFWFVSENSHTVEKMLSLDETLTRKEVAYVHNVKEVY